jgi:hypothetical protein
MYRSVDENITRGSKELNLVLSLGAAVFIATLQNLTIKAVITCTNLSTNRKNMRFRALYQTSNHFSQTQEQC